MYTTRAKHLAGRTLRAMAIVVIAGGIGSVGAAHAAPQRLAMDNMGMPQGNSPSMPMDNDSSRMNPQGGAAQGGMQMPPASAGGQNMQSQPGGMMNDGMMRMMENMMRMMQMPAMAPSPGPVDLTDRIDGRIAFLRAELRITEAQNPTWNVFADALKASRGHLLDARRALLETSARPIDRLESRERHLAARLEALRAVRSSFTQLFSVLNDSQKRAAEELIIPLLGTF